MKGDPRMDACGRAPVRMTFHGGAADDASHRTAIAERWFLLDADEEKRVDRRSAGAQAEEYV
jgi:hypothetical protein